VSRQILVVLGFPLSSAVAPKQYSVILRARAVGPRSHIRAIGVGGAKDLLLALAAGDVIPSQNRLAQIRDLLFGGAQPAIRNTLNPAVYLLGG
jgi:hypothetical protein